MGTTGRQPLVQRTRNTRGDANGLHPDHPCRWRATYLPRRGNATRPGKPVRSGGVGAIAHCTRIAQDYRFAQAFRLMSTRCGAVTIRSGRPGMSRGYRHEACTRNRELVRSYAVCHAREKVKNPPQKAEIRRLFRSGSHGRGLHLRSRRTAATPAGHTPSKSRLTSALWEQFQPNALEFLSFSR